MRGRDIIVCADAFVRKRDSDFFLVREQNIIICAGRVCTDTGFIFIMGPRDYPTSQLAGKTLGIALVKTDPRASCGPSRAAHSFLIGIVLHAIIFIECFLLYD